MAKNEDTSQTFPKILMKEYILTTIEPRRKTVFTIVDDLDINLEYTMTRFAKEFYMAGFTIYSLKLNIY